MTALERAESAPVAAVTASVPAQQERRRLAVALVAGRAARRRARRFRSRFRGFGRFLLPYVPIVLIACLTAAAYAVFLKGN